MQKFDDMYIRVLEEKFYTYKMPENKSLTMYDFYVLDYLKYLLDQPSKNFRDLPTDLEDSVKQAVQNLYPALREELLNAVFYAICAEIRHAKTYSTFNKDLIKNTLDYPELYRNWLKYLNYHEKSVESQKEMEELYGVHGISTRKRVPESEKGNDPGRNMSFKAANYAIKQTGKSTKDFVEMCEYLYSNGRWTSSYGGSAWANICKGWLMLYNADRIETGIKDKSFEDKKDRQYNKPMSVAIDHIYDLQHNTDTVFNKLKAYYNRGYHWIKKALDDKANVQSYHQLLNKCSGTVKQMALPILYNKLGTTWEKEMKIEKPVRVEPVPLQPQEDLVKSPEESNSPIPIKVGMKIKTSGGLDIYEVIQIKNARAVILKNLETHNVFDYKIKHFIAGVEAGTIKVVSTPNEEDKNPLNLKPGDIFVDNESKTKFKIVSMEGEKLQYGPYKGGMLAATTVKDITNAINANVFSIVKDSDVDEDSDSIKIGQSFKFSEGDIYQITDINKSNNSLVFKNITTGTTGLSYSITMLKNELEKGTFKLVRSLDPKPKRIFKFKIGDVIKHTQDGGKTSVIYHIKDYRGNTHYKYDVYKNGRLTAKNHTFNKETIEDFKDYESPPRHIPASKVTPELLKSKKSDSERFKFKVGDVLEYMKDGTLIKLHIKDHIITAYKRYKYDVYRDGLLNTQNKESNKSLLEDMNFGDSKVIVIPASKVTPEYLKSTYMMGQKVPAKKPKYTEGDVLVYTKSGGEWVLKVEGFKYSVSQFNDSGLELEDFKI